MKKGYLLNVKTGKWEDRTVYKRGQYFVMPGTYQGQEILCWQVYDMSDNPPQYCLATVDSRDEAIKRCNEIFEDWLKD